jgi:hypothetical protein
MNRYSLTLFVFATAAAFAQDAPSPVNEVKGMYTGVKNNWIKMAEKMPEENYSFKATPDVRTFGALVAHVADSQARTCSTLNGETKTLDAGKKSSKAELVAALKESFAMCDAAFDKLTLANMAEGVTMGRAQRTRIGALAGTVSHSNEEYGYTSIYLRLKGIVPPSSEPRN